jgi:hypothetical protein
LLDDLLLIWWKVTKGKYVMFTYIEYLQPVQAEKESADDERRSCIYPMEWNITVLNKVQSCRRDVFVLQTERGKGATGLTGPSRT